MSLARAKLVPVTLAVLAVFTLLPTIGIGPPLRGTSDSRVPSPPSSSSSSSSSSSPPPAASAATAQSCNTAALAAAGRPPVDAVWRARSTRSIEFGGRGKSVTVFRHDFPGSTLWLDFWDMVEGARWEEDTLCVFEWFLSRDPKSVLVDFGSWIGPTVLWGGLFASRVLSLEPDPVSFSTLVANVNANPETAAKTSIFWECIAPEAGLVPMAGSGESNTRMTGVLDAKFLKAGSQWAVPCRTLPGFLAEERVDLAHLQLVKMDTEGAELALLPSLRPWLESLGIHAPFWLDKDKRQSEIRAAWDVLKLFEFVYDHELRRVFPAKVRGVGEWLEESCLD